MGSGKKKKLPKVKQKAMLEVPAIKRGPEDPILDLPESEDDDLTLNIYGDATDVQNLVEVMQECLKKMDTFKGIINQQNTRINQLENENKSLKQEMYYLAEKDEIQDNLNRKNNVILKNSKGKKLNVISEVSKNMKKTVSEARNLVKSVQQCGNVTKICLKENGATNMTLSKGDSSLFKRDVGKISRVKKYLLGKLNISFHFRILLFAS